jgi:hypothetical protein
MTTKQIMEADETGRFAERVCGHAGALIRGLQRQGLFTRKPLEFEFGDGLLTPGALGPGGNLTWEQAGYTSEEFDHFLKLKGKVI